MQDRRLIACHDCDLLHRLPTLDNTGALHCVRCNALLYQYRHNSLNRTLALIITAGVLFILANTYPFIVLHTQGQTIDSTLLSGSIALYDSGYPWLSALVLLTVIIFPLINILGMLFILASMKMGIRLWRSQVLYRFLHIAKPWAMLEVLLLGVLVASVKLADVALVLPGIALYSFILVIITLAIADTTLDPHMIFLDSEINE